MDSKLSVRRLEPDEYTRWDAFVDQTPTGTVFSKSYWLQAHAEAFDRSIAVYGCFRGAELVAGCALLYRTFAGLRLVSVPPSTPYMGIVVRPRQVADPAQKARHILDTGALLASALESDFDRVVLVNPPDVIDMRPFQWRAWSVRVQYTYAIALTGPFQIARDLRRKLKQAEGLGFEVRRCIDAKAFFEVWRSDLDRLGLDPGFSLEGFTKVFNCLQGQQCCRLYLVRDPSGKTIAGLTAVAIGRKCCGWVLGTDPDYLATGITSLLLHYTIQDLKDNYDVFDLAGANIRSVAQYKSQFGGELKPYYETSIARSAAVRGLMALHRPLARVRMRLRGFHRSRA